MHKIQTVVHVSHLRQVDTQPGIQDVSMDLDSFLATACDLLALESAAERPSELYWHLNSYSIS